MGVNLPPVIQPPRNASQSLNEHEEKDEIHADDRARNAVVGGLSRFRAPASGVACHDSFACDEPFPRFADRWEEVPEIAYVPTERLKALDIDGVDAEVLFPNAPFTNLYAYEDSDFELDATSAYNDALAEWAQESDRYVPLAGVAFLGGPEAAAIEAERAASIGHRGINLMGEFPASVPHIGDPAWNPLWDTCQSLGIPVHFHGSSGVKAGARAKAGTSSDVNNNGVSVPSALDGSPATATTTQRRRTAPPRCAARSDASRNILGTPSRRARSARPFEPLSSEYRHPKNGHPGCPYSRKYRHPDAHIYVNMGTRMPIFLVNIGMPL